MRVEESAHRIVRIHLVHRAVRPERRGEIPFENVRPSRHAAGQGCEGVDLHQSSDPGPRRRDASRDQIAVAQQPERIRITPVRLESHLEVAHCLLNPASRVMHPAAKPQSRDRVGSDFEDLLDVRVGHLERRSAEVEPGLTILQVCVAERRVEVGALSDHG